LGIAFPCAVKENSLTCGKRVGNWIVVDTASTWFLSSGGQLAQHPHFTHLPISFKLVRSKELEI
jgi:hypothetical protein